MRLATLMTRLKKLFFNTIESEKVLYKFLYIRDKFYEIGRVVMVSQSVKVVLNHDVL